MANLEDKFESFSGDYFELLPKELLLKIFSFLSHKDLLQSAKPVCCDWWKTSKDPTLWKMVDLSTGLRVNLGHLFQHAYLLEELVIDDLEVEGYDCTLSELLSSYSECLPRLKELQLLNNNLPPPEVFRVLVANCPHLETIVLRNCYISPWETLLFITYITDLKHLKNLTLCNVPITDGCLELIATKCTEIRQFHVDEDSATENGYCFFLDKRKDTLETFGFCLYQFSDKLVRSIQKCVNLTQVSFYTDTNVDPGLSVAISVLPRLEKLSVRCYPEPREVVGRSLLPFFSNPHRAVLKTLHIGTVIISDDTLIELSKTCVNLTHLCFNMFGVTDVGFGHVRRGCVNLRILYIMGDTNSPMYRLRSENRLEHFLTIFDNMELIDDYCFVRTGIRVSREDKDFYAPLFH